VELVVLAVPVLAEPVLAVPVLAEAVLEEVPVELFPHFQSPPRLAFLLSLVSEHSDSCVACGFCSPPEAAVVAAGLVIETETAEVFVLVEEIDLQIYPLELP
jgi:hypothetical protein